MGNYYGTDIRYGTSAVDRCLEILPYWEEEITPAELYNKVLRESPRTDMTSRTQYHFIRELFKHRFMEPEVVAWTRILAANSTGFSRRIVEQIIFLLAARADAMVRDFFTMEYWPRVREGYTVIDSTTTKNFIEASANAGRGGTVWTDSRKKRLATGLMGICTGFGFIAKTGKPRYRVLPPLMEPAVAALLAYDLHEQGLSPNAVVGHVDWKLFGLSAAEVVDMLRSSRFTSLFLVQSSGDLVDISWKCASMAEVSKKYVCR